MKFSPKNQKHLDEMHSKLKEVHDVEKDDDTHTTYSVGGHSFNVRKKYEKDINHHATVSYMENK